MITTRIALGAAAVALIALAGCDGHRSAAQKAGDETKGAMEHTGNGLKRAADKTGDVAQNTGEHIHDATH